MDAITFGSTYEENVYRALAQRKVDFEYQVPFFGGRAVRGGQVVDFLVYGLGRKPIALFVDGPYWHKGRKTLEDQLKRTQLERAGYQVLVIGAESETFEQTLQWLMENLK